MRYLLLLLIFGACTKYRNKQGYTELIKHELDSIRCFGDMAPCGSSIYFSDSGYIYNLDKYLNDSTYTFESEDSIVYIFNDSTLLVDTLRSMGQELMYGENVPLGRIIHDHRDAKACTACKLRNAYINVWKNYYFNGKLIKNR